ncbi:hypothetical protein AB0I81_40345 [Nonomuraea sp. NPDC050404]|uniref:hypothetical protein n=1 Tax=Nonomuraea sp. NPDC050404 TaxID=3155783 RepID=UPI0034050080
MTDVAKIIARRSGLNMAEGKQKVWRWEHGKAVPEMASQRALADELEIDPNFLFRLPWPDWLQLAYVIDVTRPWDEPQAMLALTGSVDAILDRRQFFAFSGEAAVMLAHAWSSAPVGQLARGVEGKRVDTEVASWVEGRIPELWHLDDLVGGESCLDVAVSQLRLVVRLLSRGSYSEAVGRRLHASAAELARFTGWAAFDAGKHTAAERYWHAGLRASATAGDVGTGAYILSQMAMQRTYSGDGTTAVDLLEAARVRAGTRVSRTVHAMLDAWQVRAHAVAGESLPAAKTLLRADDHWSARRPEDDPAWVYWMRRPSTTIEVGMAFSALGEPDTAEELLAEGMQARGHDYERDRVLGWTAIATARLEQGEIEGAIEAAGEAAETAAAIDSSRVMDEMEAFTSRLPAREAGEFRSRLQELS